MSSSSSSYPSIESNPYHPHFTPSNVILFYILLSMIKGSTVNRMSGSGGGVLKDLDLKERGKTIHLGNKRKPFLNQLKKDVKVSNISYPSICR